MKFLKTKFEVNDYNNFLNEIRKKPIIEVIAMKECFLIEYERRCEINKKVVVGFLLTSIAALILKVNFINDYITLFAVVFCIIGAIYAEIGELNRIYSFKLKFKVLENYLDEKNYKSKKAK